MNAEAEFARHLVARRRCPRDAHGIAAVARPERTTWNVQRLPAAVRAMYTVAACWHTTHAHAVKRTAMAELAASRTQRMN